MNGEADLAAVGALLADRTRAVILMTLLGGGLSSASALASRAGVSRSLASHHLRTLVNGGLIVVELRGRQRDYRLASQSIADGLEALIPLAPTAPVRSLRGAQERDRLRGARMCYDHLAGFAGVALADGLVNGGLLCRDGEDFAVTAVGRQTFGELDIDLNALARRSRPLARGCRDWSEGREHLAGSLGAALTAELLKRDWLQTGEVTRAVTVTEEGSRELRLRFGIELRAENVRGGHPARIAA